MSKEYEQFVSLFKKRWPAIGRRLDHPLAEWYFEKSRKHSAIWALAYRCLILIACLAFIVMAMPNPQIMIILFYAGILARFKFAPGKSNPARLFAAKDKRLLHDLWQTPIDYSHLAAISAMVRMKGLLSGWFRNIALVCVNPVFVYLYWNYYLKSNFLSIAAWFLLVSGLIFLNSVTVVITDPERQLQAALKEFEQVVDKRALSGEQMYDSFGSGCGIVAMMLTLGGAYFVICASVYILFKLEATAEFFLNCISCALLAFSAFWVWFLVKSQPFRTRAKFREMCRSGRRKYAGIIAAEMDNNVNAEN
ncbi:hypothetical protein LLG95_14880 [bacterium]|nr:hypothetical protein [bacterium]